MEDVYMRWKESSMFDIKLEIKQPIEVENNDCIGNEPEFFEFPILCRLINSLPLGTEIVSIIKPPPSSIFIINSTTIGIYEDDGSISLLDVENHKNFTVTKEYTKWLILNKNKINEK